MELSYLLGKSLLYRVTNLQYLPTHLVTAKLAIKPILTTQLTTAQSTTAAYTKFLFRKAIMS
jgi:hypothetical protein